MLQRQLGAEPQINRADNLALPAPEEAEAIAKPAQGGGSEDKDGGHQDAQGHEDGAEQQQLQRHLAALRIDELRQEGEKEQRRLRIEYFRQHGLGKSLARRD